MLEKKKEEQKKWEAACSAEQMSLLGIDAIEVMRSR